MKYLDDRIILKVPQITIPSSGTYTYRLYRGHYLPIAPITDYTLLFVGKSYLQPSDTELSVDVTDLIADDKWVAKEMVEEYTTYQKQVSIVDSYFISIEINGVEIFSGSSEEVAKVYRYPNHKTYLNTELHSQLSARTDSVMLQGSLIPRIPFVSSTEYPLLSVIQTYNKSEKNKYSYKFSGDIEGVDKRITSMTNGETLTCINLFDLFTDVTTTINHQIGEVWCDYKSVKQIKLADVDICPSRYYLMWQDRYGSFQSQPFDKIETFSEDFDRLEIRDYSNNRRNAQINVQPKWQINSDWISTINYPYYESIFTSPFLVLYDTKEDTSYSVLCTDSEYTEKTVQNQRHQLFNLTLNLELSKQQNILY